jgi:3-hydroxyisobutyrate dehydrogenase
MNVGVIGLGRMGSAIARRLADQGFTVTGWDTNPLAVRALAESGLPTSAHARAVADASEIIITSVTEDSGVIEIFGAIERVLQDRLDGKLFVEMSTLRPPTVRELAPALEALGARIVDAPVLGTIPNVRNGTLVALIGGWPQDVEGARPVLAALTRRIVHMGPLGSGHAMKLAANLGLAAYIQGLAESLALGEREGLDIDTMLDVLGGSVTANAWLPARLGVLKGDAAELTLDIRTLRKDIMSLVATGALGGVPMPLASAVLSALSAAVAAGWGAADIAEMPRFFRVSAVQRFGSLRHDHPAVDDDRLPGDERGVS